MVRFIRKEKYEIELNTQGKYSDQAKSTSRLVKRLLILIKANTAGNVVRWPYQRRSERYASKIFLSHLLTVWYEMANHSYLQSHLQFIFLVIRMRS